VDFPFLGVPATSLFFNSVLTIFFKKPQKLFSQAKDNLSRKTATLTKEDYLKYQKATICPLLQVSKS